MDVEGVTLSGISQRKRLHDIAYMWNLKKYKELVNITKKQQTHRDREQTSGYQWRDREWGSGKEQTIWYKIGSGCIVQHREYSQYFAGAINGI